MCWSVNASGDVDGAGAYRRAGLRLGLMLYAVPAVPVLLMPAVVFRLVTNDPAVISTATSAVLLAVVSLAPIVAAVNLGGVLRAAGDSRTVMLASLLADLFLVTLAWLLGIRFGLGLNGIFLAWLAWGLVFLARIWWRYHAGDWRTSTA